MVFVQDLLCVGDVQVILGHFVPRQTYEPVDISPADGVFSRGGMHFGQPVQFTERHFLDLFWHPSLLNLLPQLLNFRLRRLTQFLLDFPQLLPQYELTLSLVKFLPRLLLNFLSQLQDLDLPRKQRDKFLQPLDWVSHFQKALAVLRG